MAPALFLRDVLPDDLPIFFAHQQEPAANAMAGFPPRDRPSFMAHWAKILADPANITQTIVYDGQVVGHIACYPQDGQAHIGYWLGQAFWGSGIASSALRLFVHGLHVRPLYAYVARQNVASLRVLQKCGFAIIEELSATAEHPVEELFLRLDDAAAAP